MNWDGRVMDGWWIMVGEPYSSFSRSCWHVLSFGSLLVVFRNPLVALQCLPIAITCPFYNNPERG